MGSHRLWRQQIQDWLIAGIQNIRTLLKAHKKRASGARALVEGAFALQNWSRNHFAITTHTWNRHRRFQCSLGPALAHPADSASSSLPEVLWATCPRQLTNGVRRS